MYVIKRLEKITEKEKGFKKALRGIIDNVKANYTFHEDFAYPIIAHTDAQEDAELFAKMFEEEFNVKPEIRMIGPIIGAHLGPNAVALTFLSNEQRKY